jgi:acetyltransferase-like isoleucine patch superfamily enzyme
MKTGLQLYVKYRKFIAYINVFRFWFKKSIIGFDAANLFLQRVDKVSTQLILIKNGAKIGINCDIESGLIFHNCRNYKNLIIGDNCHIGKNCFFDLKDKIEIGNNVVISMLCTFITHIHTGNSQLSKSFPPESAPIMIRDDCYLGVHTTILKNTMLNSSAFIAAGSLVTKDVTENTMVGGIPARRIKTL